MSGINERIRREIQASGSPLAHHSINQKKTGRERWGNKRFSNTSDENRKAYKAKERRRKKAEVLGGTENSNIAPKGIIVFPEDLE